MPLKTLRVSGLSLALALVVSIWVPLPPSQATPTPVAPDIEAQTFTADPAAVDEVEDAAAEATQDALAPTEDAAAVPEDPAAVSGDAAAAPEDAVVAPADPAPAPTDDQPVQVLSASRTASGFAIAGVTWTEGADEAGLEVTIRTRSGGSWTEWEPIEIEETVYEGGAPKGDATRAGTGPAVLGEVDEVEARLISTDGTFPSDPELVVIDPGASAADARAGVTGSGSAHAATARPTIVSRAQWGADERLLDWTPSVGRVSAAVIHHTAGSNAYTQSDVPSIIRGIYAYHAQSRGWGDIGYNFLVDKFGRTYEGRAGGVDKAITAAHAVGVNSETFGVSLIGNYDQVGVPAVAAEAISAVIAWKFSVHGVDPYGTAVLAGRVQSTITGHREVGQTACPGRYFTPGYGGIKASVASRMGGSGDRALDRDLTGDGVGDVLLSNGGRIVASGPSGPGAMVDPAAWTDHRQVGRGWDEKRTIAAGRWDADAYPDLMLLDTAGVLRLYAGTSSKGWAAARTIGSGWNSMDRVIGGQDWNGDGRNDLVARGAGNGALWLYPGNGTGGFGARVQIGSGWQTMTSLATAGSLTGRPGILARDAAGVLYLYDGDGKGGFGPRRVVGPGWNIMSSFTGAGDVDGDGRADLVARTTSGELRLYPGNGSGGFGAPVRLAPSWGASTVLPAEPGRAGRTTFFSVDAQGGLLSDTLDYEAPVLASTGIAHSTSVVDVIAPGDWTGDGRADLLVRRTNGDVVLHVGQGGGAYAASGSTVGTGWSIMTQVVGVTNWGGDGRPGVVALEKGTGKLWLYPGTGTGGFRGDRVLLSSGLGRADLIVSVGQFSGRATPEILVRMTNGDLDLYRGAGYSLLRAPVRAGQGWGIMTSIVGVGDISGDGRPDVVGLRKDSGKYVLYPGNGRGGFGPTTVLSGIPTTTSKAW